MRARQSHKIESNSIPEKISIDFQWFFLPSGMIGVWNAWQTRRRTMTALSTRHGNYPHYAHPRSGTSIENIDFSFFEFYGYEMSKPHFHSTLHPEDWTFIEIQILNDELPLKDENKQSTLSIRIEFWNQAEEAAFKLKENIHLSFSIRPLARFIDWRYIWNRRE